MARVTIEDCVEHISNRFLLVQAAVRRTRQIMEGSRPTVPVKNRSGVVALREIAAQKVIPVLDTSKPPVVDAAPREAEEDDALLSVAIEEVTVEQMRARGSLQDLTALEGLSEDGFHEILAEEVEGKEDDED